MTLTELADWVEDDGTPRQHRKDVVTILRALAKEEPEMRRANDWYRARGAHERQGSGPGAGPIARLLQAIDGVERVAALGESDDLSGV